MEKYKDHVQQVTFAGLGFNLSSVMMFMSSLPRLERLLLDGVQMILDGVHPVPLLAWLNSDELALEVPVLRSVAVVRCVLDMGALFVMLKRLGPLEELSIEDDVFDEAQRDSRAGLRGMSVDDLQKLPRAIREVKRLRLVNTLSGAFSVGGSGPLSGLAWMGIHGLRAITLSLYSTPTDLLLAQLITRNANTLEELTIHAEGAFKRQ